MSESRDNQTFHDGARSVPFPPNLAPLLRPNDPGRHWAGVLRSIFGRAAAGRYDTARVADCQQLRQLLERRCTDPRAGEYVVRLLPPKPCAICRKHFLAESARARYCCDRCQWAGKRAVRGAVPS